MRATDDSTRVLRTAAWIWLGFLLGMAVMDFALYTPQIQRFFGVGAHIQIQPLPPRPDNSALPIPLPLLPVYLFYLLNGTAALLFLLVAYWNSLQDQLGEMFYPLMLALISTAPIFISAFVVPRFPPGPLANAEGMTLRQVPVLFIALTLVAWKYRFVHVVFFSFTVAALEFSLIIIARFQNPSIFFLLFIAIVRTISFVTVGYFISVLVSRLREQRESLQKANADLTHYASTLERLTVSRERNRLARELHDTLAHTLTGLSVTLETVKAYWDVDGERARALLEKSLETTRKGLDETRRALKSLRAAPLEDLGFGLALRQMAESAAARVHLDLELALPDPMPNLAPDVEQCIYRVAQEAIENVVHHANAKKVSLKLEPHGEHIRLIVQDNGLGFDPHDKVSTGHFGLVGMKERTQLAGGKLTIESQKGKGTKVILEI